MGTYRVAHLDDIEAVPGPGTLTWRPVRASLGIRAFGTNAYTAEEATVLSFGGPAVFAPSAWEWGFQADAVAAEDPARARAILEEGLAAHPDSPSLRQRLARLP